MSVTAKKRGRPPQIADPEALQKLDHYASIGLRHKEIADLLGITEPTLVARYGSLLRKKRIEAKEKVLTKQFEAACAGVVPMSIWWGKNYGEQSDRADVTSGGEALKIVVERIG